MSEEKSISNKPATKRCTACLVLPLLLHDRLRSLASERKSSVSSIVEGWIEKHVSLQDVSFGLVAAMNGTGHTRSTIEPQADLQKLTVSLSKRHYGMLRMESVRRNMSIRSLLRDWTEENTQDYDSHEKMEVT